VLKKSFDPYRFKDSAIRCPRTLLHCDIWCYSDGFVIIIKIQVFCRSVIIILTQCLFATLTGRITGLARSSVRPSVSLSVPYELLLRKKNKIGVKYQGRSIRCTNLSEQKAKGQCWGCAVLRIVKRTAAHYVGTGLV